MSTFNLQSWSAGPLSFGLGIFGLILTLILVIALISLKGYALWHAARRSDKVWFVFILIFNTVGILELVYLIFIVGKWHKFKDSGTPPTPTDSSVTPPTVNN